MKRYTVLAVSMTGVKGKHLDGGKDYPESDFINLKEHLAEKHIALYEPPKEETKKEEKVR